MTKETTECGGAGPVELRDDEMKTARGGIIGILIGLKSPKDADTSNGLLIAGDGADFMEGGEGFDVAKT
jgi:hypothetical protein